MCKILVFLFAFFLSFFGFTTSASAFNNPYLSMKDCSGVLINDTTSGFAEKKVNYGDGTGLTTYMNHQYLHSGIYVIKYFRYNSSSIPIDSFIDVLQIALTTNSIFYYKTHCTTIGQGIFNFHFLNINKSSGTALGECVVDDYTCTDQAIVNEGQSYNVSATTDSIFTEYITVFLDANADGRFQRQEIIGESAAFQNHLFQITIPHIHDTLLGVPLRLRVVCTRDGTVPFFNPGSGHWYYVNDLEDYSVIINSHTTNPPQASFTTYTFCDGLLVAFLNTSAGAPDSVKWYFPDGSVSNEFSPYYTYPTKSSQYIDFVAYNSNGSDSIHSELDNPALPHIIHTDPAYPNQQITFQTGQYPKPLSWRWTFPEIPMQTFGPITYNTYTTTGAFPYTLTFEYYFSDIIYSGYYRCVVTTDDTIFIIANSVHDNPESKDICVLNHSGIALVNINSSNFGKVKISTVNLQGQVENQFTFNKTSLSFSEEIFLKHTGLYLIVIETSDGRYVRKFMTIQ